MDRHLRAYLRDLRKERRSGQATEHSYRPALKKLIEAAGPPGIQAVNEPTQGEYGAPDFIVHQNGVPVGHVECKDIGANLDEVEESAQLRRYRDALPNLILTDYVEFRWYVNGEQRLSGILAHSDDEKLQVAPSVDLSSVTALLEGFFNADGVSINNAAELAQRMAAKARLLREHIAGIFRENDGGSAALRELLASYQEVLIADLSEEQFADLQAQTVAYGLFAARWLYEGAPPTFTRETAAFAQTTPFLRDVFGRVAGPSADRRITWIINDLARLLARADMAAILEDFGKRTKREDPTVHFYEDFLAVYDRELKVQHGVYYTPEPVVSYIVRSVDWLLRDKFGLEDGLADTATIEVESEDGETEDVPRVLILDPAAGTGSFLREVVSVIHGDLEQRGLGGGWRDYVDKHLLPRLFGFELLMAPYAIAHLKLAIEIGDDPRRFMMPNGGRLNVFLTNALEEAHKEAAVAMFAAEIAQEARQADAVKRDHPVMVVIGNPPYAGHSANKGKWIRDLLRGRIEGSPASYFHIDGKPLGEQNSKWLNDDYVKFIRFAQWRIEQTGEGVLGFVTNHSYLDNPTFRGMRRSLLETFDEIYILDLHGNSKKQERPPDGGSDQNVFDIQQGVAVALFVKHSVGVAKGRIFHGDLWGQREEGPGGGKYGWLAANDVTTTNWTELAPKSPDYWFVQRDEALADEYEASWALTDIFPVSSVGVVTARDKLAIQWSKDEMARVARDFAARTEEDARERYVLGRDSRDWKVSLAQADLREHPNSDQHITAILYRPFDLRHTYYTGTLRGFICMPRTEVMHHMRANGNRAICAGRAGQAIGPGTWDAVFPAASPTDFNLYRRGGNCLFPLYVYAEACDLDLDVPDRAPNLAPEFTDALANAFRLEFTPEGSGDLEADFGPEDVFHYIYAILHSPEYRQRYADFLKSDFPRIPVPDRRRGRGIVRRRRELFAQLVKLGERLAALHLMETAGSEQPAFSTRGTNLVEKIRYAAPATAEEPGHVYINATQHFEGVAPETWAFTIGGYQPAQKWLKDRKGRTLSFDEIEHYQRICAALAETPTLMAGIDEAIEAHGGWPLSEAEA